MKRKIDDMEIVWQTPANPPERHDYIFCDGMRYVRPYYFEFISHVINRWAGKTIVDLFTKEFKGRPRDYYVWHEPPVMALDVEILHKEDEVLAVCKPASVPVHPCGKYCKNTVVGILQAEHDLAPVFHRLVSRLLILARNSSRADLFRQQIEAGLVHKQYIARVIGVFPEHEIRVHLQYTGHPIANDVLYLSKPIVERSAVGLSADRAAAKSGLSVNNDSCEHHKMDPNESSTEDFRIDPMCTNCPYLAPKGYGGYEEGLWLHCVRYRGSGWSYECPYPDWAILS